MDAGFSKWAIAPRCHTVRMRDDLELIGGREKRAIVIVEHDPSWADAFACEHRRIATALAAAAHRIDHIGSTAVEGLPAKPIIDIDVSVSDIEDETSYLPALHDAGYRLRVREHGHRMVRAVDLSVHVHVCQAGSNWERRHLLFRDFLRASEVDRQAYAALKHALAAQEWPDMNAYADTKGPLIDQITGRAEKWANTTGWNLPR